MRSFSLSLTHAHVAPPTPQGRWLNTPELVPFRLTRDILDGCGIAGSDGTLRQCCEVTLRVLRAAREALVQVRVGGRGGDGNGCAIGLWAAGQGCAPP